MSFLPSIVYPVANDTGKGSNALVTLNSHWLQSSRLLLPAPPPPLSPLASWLQHRHHPAWRCCFTLLWAIRAFLWITEGWLYRGLRDFFSSSSPPSVFITSIRLCHNHWQAFDPVVVHSWELDFELGRLPCRTGCPHFFQGHPSGVAITTAFYWFIYLFSVSPHQCCSYLRHNTLRCTTACGS